MKYTEKKENKQNSKILNISYSEYCKLITLARQIVKENQKEIEEKNSSAKLKFFDNELKKKYNLNSYINDDPEINIILRNNILIPDTNTFFKDYNETGKNIRILAEKYNVSAPVIINKITEIGTYGDYLNQINQEGIESTQTTPKTETTPQTEPPIVNEITKTTNDLTSKIMQVIKQEVGQQEENLKKITEENEKLVHLNNLLREKIENLTEENKKLKAQIKKANTKIDYVKNFMNIAENTISSFEQEEHLKAS